MYSIHAATIELRDTTLVLLWRWRAVCLNPAVDVPKDAGVMSWDVRRQRGCFVEGCPTNDPVSNF